MKTGHPLTALTSFVATTIAAVMLSCSLPAFSCSLEPTINGGFTISYPGSLKVAVAVADARTKGLLPPVNKEAITNEIRLQQMLTDLRHLQVRLNEARNKIPEDNATPFSVVLVGPGLWSHFHITTAGVQAHYHTNGPLDDKAVVLTHATALRAMLEGNLSIEQATELGLITYSGSAIEPVQKTLEIGLQVKT
jgi:hypothetical protein